VNGIPWSAADKAYIRTHYRTLGAAATAAALGRTVQAVRQQASRMGVLKNYRSTASVSSLRKQVTALTQREQVLRQALLQSGTDPDALLNGDM
jgi:hypothetical protein